MKRRDALKSVAILLGTAISASTLSVIFDSCNQEQATQGATLELSKLQQDLLDEFVEVIMPKTSDSGGAKEAGVGPFIPMMLNDCFPSERREAFLKGLDAFEKTVKEKYGKNFAALTPEQRLEAVKTLRELVISQKEKKDEEKDPQVNFFYTARDLTMLGYYSSEIGCTQNLVYVDIPGKYQGDVPLKPGQKRWA